MGKNKWFILFAICLAVGFAAAPAMAKEQGAAIQVDSDTNCNTTNADTGGNSADRQDNTTSLSIVVWFNLSTAPTGDYTWTLSDKGKEICSGTIDDASLIQCGAPEDQWWHTGVDIDLDGTPTPSTGTCTPTGSVTFAVFERVARVWVPIAFGSKHPSQTEILKVWPPGQLSHAQSRRFLPLDLPNHNQLLAKRFTRASLRASAKSTTLKLNRATSPRIFDAS